MCLGFIQGADTSIRKIWSHGSRCVHAASSRWTVIYDDASYQDHKACGLFSKLATSVSTLGGANCETRLLVKFNDLTEMHQQQCILHSGDIVQSVCI